MGNTMFVVELQAQRNAYGINSTADECRLIEGMYVALLAPDCYMESGTYKAYLAL